MYVQFGKATASADWAVRCAQVQATGGTLQRISSDLDSTRHQNAELEARALKHKQRADAAAGELLATQKQLLQCQVSQACIFPEGAVHREQQHSLQAERSGFDMATYMCVSLKLMHLTCSDDPTAIVLATRLWYMGDGSVGKLMLTMNTK